jgi:hypothetical protein
VKAPRWASLRRRLDPFDVAVLIAFALLSVWLLAQVALSERAGRVWIGTDGLYVGDQAQYIAWIRESAGQVLIANPFKIRSTAATFLHPGLVVSGIVARFGVEPWITYLLWKPAAVVSLFVAARAYAWRLLPGKAQRRCALILALFYVAPAALLANSFDLNRDLIVLQAIVLDMWPGLYLWGYPFTAIAVAALPGALLAYERDRRFGRIRPWAPVLGLFCAWLQPWQGATLLAILLVSETILWRLDSRVRLALPATTAFATVAPLCYYALLSRLDPSWTLAGKANAADVFPWWTLAFSLAFLAVPAALAYVSRPDTFQAVAVRVWAPAALAIYCLIGIAHLGTFPLHALQGLSIPFAVLAVAGASTVRPSWPAAAKLAIATILVALLIVPALARELNRTRSLAGDSNAATLGVTGPFITASERDALDYLNRTHGPGGVLARQPLGLLVPAETGRHTWVGLLSWTPDFDRRVHLADALLGGRLVPTETRSLVRSSRAQFVLSDCESRVDLTDALRPMLESVRRFGCATVYRVRLSPA